MRCPRFALAWSLGIAALFVALPAWATPVRIELENFTSSHNIYPDDPYSADGILLGLDYPGEWTRYETPVLDPGLHSITLKFWSIPGQPCEMQVVLEDPLGSSQPTTFNFVGRGSCQSCGGLPQYPVGNELVQFTVNPATLTLHFVSGETFEGDWLEITPVLAVDGATWSAVKQLFR